MQTKTLSNLVLEFPVLEKTTSKALKGGSYDPWAEIARLRGDYSWNSFTHWGGAWWDSGGNYLGTPIVVNGHSWHNDPYDVRNGSGNAGWDITQTGGGSSGGGGFPYADLRDQASLAIDHAGAWQDFYVVGQRAFDGTLKTDMNSLFHEIVEMPSVKELFSSLQGDGVFKGIAVLDKVGKVLGVVGAAESAVTLARDLMDGDGQVSTKNIIDAGVNIGSLFLKSNIVGFAVSGGWMLIKGEFFPE